MTTLNNFETSLKTLLQTNKPKKGGRGGKNKTKERKMANELTASTNWQSLVLIWMACMEESKCRTYL